MSIILGIDPGAHGAIAVLNESGDQSAHAPSDAAERNFGRFLQNSPFNKGAVS